MNILFWNFHCDDASEQSEALAALGRLAVSQSIDLVALADTSAGKPKRVLAPELVLNALDKAGTSFEKTDDPPGPSIPLAQIYTRFPGGRLKPFRADDRLDIRRYRWDDREEVLLGVVHFFDRRNYSQQSQTILACRESATLNEAEISAGHARTALFGDFNMNPYELGMTTSDGFGAMMTRDLTTRHTGPEAATGHGPKRFYNPSWARMGRDAEFPTGTYYWDVGSNPENVFWHHLDQVIVRPDLFRTFRDESFRILKSLPGVEGNEITLIQSKRKHWKLRYSDHLPIMFSLDLDKLNPAKRGGNDA